MVIRGSGSSISYLKGTLKERENGGTLVDLVVCPNSVFMILSFTFPIVALIALFKGSNANNSFWKNLLVSLAFIFFVPLYCIIYSAYAKKNLKDRFVKHFDLQSRY